MGNGIKSHLTDEEMYDAVEDSFRFLRDLLGQFKTKTLDSADYANVAALSKVLVRHAAYLRKYRFEDVCMRKPAGKKS